MVLCAVGPLTNLALALQADPEVAHLLKSVVIMGGAFGVAGKPGNVTPGVAHHRANSSGTMIARPRAISGLRRP